MSGDVRRISVLACVLLVVVRMAIGWHLMYEGLWKIQSQSTTTPWSAEGYLKNSTGPMRGYFRSLTGDPNDLRWLDYDAMTAKWSDWEQRFLAHYFAGVDPADGARGRLQQLLHGAENFSVKLEALPEAVANAAKENVIIPARIEGKDQKVLWYEPEKQRLVADGKLHLLPDEKKKAADLAPEDAKYVKALDDLFKQQSKLSFHERLAAMLKGDPDRIGVLRTASDGAIIENRMGEVEHYKQKIDRYEAKLKSTRQAFEWNHLERLWRELQEQRRELVGPVLALENEMKIDAEKLLSESQLSLGPVPEPLTAMRRINLQTMWGLTIIGGLLIAGLFSRLSSLAGAGLLFMFYLAIPPLPGTPPEAGPEHNFIVNKVLVESLMLLAFAALPSGRWFGIDALFGALFRRRVTP
ncbi:MAG: hypothetical protein U0872_01515 [Planctomycetaceae bacterium]